MSTRRKVVKVHAFDVTRRRPPAPAIASRTWSRAELAEPGTVRGGPGDYEMPRSCEAQPDSDRASAPELTWGPLPGPSPVFRSEVPGPGGYALGTPLGTPQTILHSAQATTIAGRERFGAITEISGPGPAAVNLGGGTGKLMNLPSQLLAPRAVFGSESREGAKVVQRSPGPVHDIDKKKTWDAVKRRAPMWGIVGRRRQMRYVPATAALTFYRLAVPRPRPLTSPHPSPGASTFTVAGVAGCGNQPDSERRSAPSFSLGARWRGPSKLCPPDSVPGPGSYG